MSVYVCVFAKITHDRDEPYPTTSNLDLSARKKGTGGRMRDGERARMVRRTSCSLLFLPTASSHHATCLRSLLHLISSLPATSHLYRFLAGLQAQRDSEGRTDTATSPSQASTTSHKQSQVAKQTSLSLRHFNGGHDCLEPRSAHRSCY